MATFKLNQAIQAINKAGSYEQTTKQFRDDKIEMSFEELLEYTVRVKRNRSRQAYMAGYRRANALNRLAAFGVLVVTAGIAICLRIF